MLSKQYIHRLPADYDTARIRERAAARGPLWDATPGLAFKAFSLRERSRGAAGNAYGLFYLWLDAAATADFAMGGGFGTVIEGFGRPAIDLWLPLDARKGPAAAARTAAPAWLVRESIELPDTADRAAARAAEVERNGALAARAETLAVVGAVDVAAWRIVRLHITTTEPAADAAGTAWEVLHLARPGLDRLPGPAA
ncbi:DUF4865 family protein [Xylophilus sp.]|uniref:DUF4865 family protein n=1 Tax=Xylophilus sp. TaxID=2653893 RepID=UPI0013BB4A45|nr:DUF4865 family protein [Xylophilus sp.]KAF1043901.1 MAG: hypothetical protein GAK38_03788 [Xylophilus sp.]